MTAGNPSRTEPKTWLILGASRGIGREFVRQLLSPTSPSTHVVATVRNVNAGLGLDEKSGEYGGRLRVLSCDVLSEESIKDFARELGSAVAPDGAATVGGRTGRIDYAVINAGVLDYPNRATELSYDSFARHLHTNTIGPIIAAQQLLKLGEAAGVEVGMIVFMSSDSGSAARFREMEDGFAAYAASKAALNMMLRHMAAELKRQGSSITVIAMHPGEVATDMANIDLPWEIEGGQMTPEESVKAMIPVIESKGPADSGTFWTWEGAEYPW